MLGRMPTRDRLLAALVAVLWGLNFPAIHLSLEQFPPFFLVALRFALLAVPTLLLVPRPTAPWRWILLYGLGFGVLQFVFLYLAMSSGMPTGLASLVLQSSAPFTVRAGRRCSCASASPRGRASGILLAVVGLAGIAAHRAGLAGGATLVPVLLTLCGGLGWAVGNLGNRRAMQAQPGEPFRLLLWMSVVPPLPHAGAVAGRRGSRGDRRRRSRTWRSTQGLLALGGLALHGRRRDARAAAGCGPRSWDGTRPAPWPRSRCSCPWSASAPRGCCCASARQPTELAWGALVRRGRAAGQHACRRRQPGSAARRRAPWRSPRRPRRGR